MEIQFGGKQLGAFRYFKQTWFVIAYIMTGSVLGGFTELQSAAIVHRSSLIPAVLSEALTLGILDIRNGLEIPYAQTSNFSRNKVGEPVAIVDISKSWTDVLVENYFWDWEGRVGLGLLGNGILLAQGDSGTNAPTTGGGTNSEETSQSTTETSASPVSTLQEAGIEIKTNVIEQNSAGTNVTVDEQGLTNVEIFEPLLDTPLKRYNARTAGHIFWRTDALVFISIPFSFLWSTLLKEFIRNFSVVAGFFEGARAPVLSAINFPYSRDNYPAGSADPLDIFSWANLALWPAVVAANDIIERTSVPKTYERTKERMRKNRFYRDLISQNFY